MSKMGEYILRKLSRDPRNADYIHSHYEQKHKDVNVYIQTLKDTFLEFERIIANKKVLDIGCAEGMETLAISMMGADEVYGIDIFIDEKKNKEIQQQNPDRRMTFLVVDAYNTSFPDDQFDIVVTCGSFEHFSNPFSILKEIKRVLKNDGLILLTSGVWNHPWGAHMNFFTKMPWVQFAFSENTIMNVRRGYRNDGATKFNEVEGGLNRVGIRSFVRVVEDLNLKIENLKLNPVRGLTLLTKVPYINEFFTNLIIAVLRKNQ